MPFSTMATIRIRSSAGSYDVLCARGNLARIAQLTTRLGPSTGTYLLSSPRVWGLWGKKISGGFGIRRIKGVILFDDSETAKRLPTVEQIARKLIRAEADRHATLVAVGGGVMGDVGGFVAATYLRGVRLVHVPTTLVAQVDSSIGGKTGVDLPEGKNLIGAFYPPKLVVADPNVLQTLPHRELRSGLYEVVKYGIIADRKLFAYLERHMPALLRRDPKALSWVIERSMRIKARIVGKDEREIGLRQVLNFGHTLGHALEAATGYKRFAHGEAIGWGMVAATLLGVATNQIRERDAVRIIRLLMSIGPLPSLAGIQARDLRRIIAGDKKSRGGRVLWVLPSRIGKVKWGREASWPIVARTFAALPSIAMRARR
ncbi:MAG TPA: 3-dehydroquinate synthase [Candidatus Limnocylindria bacterium]|nr:3-dehydroquinate synthase [Candidatus Limnocylindria bacterium]